MRKVSQWVLQRPLSEDYGQWGGRASGAFKLTEPGHVPSEPFQFSTCFCDTVRPFCGLLWLCIDAAPTVLDLGFDCIWPEDLIGKLAVSVRQPLWPLGRCSYEDFWFVYWQTDRATWIMHSSGPRSLQQRRVVLPPCLHDGSLNTSRSWAGQRSIPGSEVPAGGHCFSLVFFTVGEYGDDFLISTGNLLYRSAHSTTLFDYIGEVGPFRLAGFDLTLQRQNLLPVVFDFSDDWLAILFWRYSLHVAIEHLLVTDPRMTDNGGAMPFQIDKGTFMPGPLSVCGGKREASLHSVAH